MSNSEAEFVMGEAEFVLSVLKAGGVCELSYGTTCISLTFNDMKEYAKYRKVGLACKEVCPSVTVLNPTDWYHKYKPTLISKKS
jgi:hypothetical protein